MTSRRNIGVRSLIAVAALLLPSLRFSDNLAENPTIPASGAPEGAPPGQTVDPASFKGTLAATPIDSPDTIPTGLYQLIGEVVVPDGEQFITRGAEEKDGYVYLLTRTDFDNASNLSGYLLTYNVTDLPGRTAFAHYDAPISSAQVLNGNGLLRNGDYLYAYGSYGLSVLSIHNPASPQVIGSKGDLEIFSLTISNHFLIAPGYGGIAVYSISDPANPTLLSIYRVPGRYFYSAAVNGNILYTYEFALNNYPIAWLRVTDFTNPASLSTIQIITRTSMGYQLKIVGQKLIVCGDGVELWSLDVAANPVFQTSQLAHARSCAVDGNTLVTNGQVFLMQGNALNPIDVFSAGFVQMDGFPYGSVIAPGFAFIAQSARILILKKNPIAQEARRDINMPFPDNGYSRGCPTAYAGCGGPFHGFNLGVSTDLVLDSYNAGAAFNIQAALAQDALAHPGRYSYNTARWADDMRVYFQNNQQFLPPYLSYKVGDIAFFNFGELHPGMSTFSGHALIVSQVDGAGRPTLMIDASSFINYVHVSSEAWEHPWTTYYDDHVQGHGRLNGAEQLLQVPTSDSGQVLRVTVDSAEVGLQVFDASGKSISAVFDDKFSGGNVESFNPFVAHAVYSDLGSHRVITVYQPFSDTSQYSVQLSGQSSTTYHLLIETLQDSLVTDSQLLTHAINASETQNISVTLTAPGGTIQFTAISPQSTPRMALPESLTISGRTGTSAQATFMVVETGGQQSINDVFFSATDLLDQSGGVISGGQILMTSSGSTVTQGGSLEIGAQANLANVPPGTYLGNLHYSSESLGSRMIPLILDVQPHNLFLPLTQKN